MKTLVWIEDDAFEIYDVVIPLERLGFTIRVFTSRTEVLGALPDLRNADLLLLDILLPVQELNDRAAGITLLRELRELGVAAPALVFSSTRQSAFDDEVLTSLDIRGWMQKPVSRYDLASAVVELLGDLPTNADQPPLPP